MDTGSFKETRQRVLEIDHKRRELSEEKKELLSVLQKECDHEVVFQFTQHPNHISNWGSARICVLCSCREDHDGAGFRVLTKEPIKQMDMSCITDYFDLKLLEDLVSKEMILTVADLL